MTFYSALDVNIFNKDGEYKTIACVYMSDFLVHGV